VLLVLQVDDWLRTVVAVAGVGAVVSHIAAARRIPLATTIAHIGFVVLALGIASSAQAETTAVVLAPGESVDFGSGQTFRYESFMVCSWTTQETRLLSFARRWCPTPTEAWR